MAKADKWDGQFPPRFLELLPNFWGGTNSVGSVMIGVPGLQQPVFAPYLEKALAAAFDMEGECLAEAVKLVRQKIREDIAPRRNEPRGWLDSWRDVTMKDLTDIGRMKMAGLL